LIAAKKSREKVHKLQKVDILEIMTKYFVATGNVAARKTTPRTTIEFIVISYRKSITFFEKYSGNAYKFCQIILVSHLLFQLVKSFFFPNQ
jgi:hypothetical protein